MLFLLVKKLTTLDDLELCLMEVGVNGFKKD